MELDVDRLGEQVATLVAERLAGLFPADATDFWLALCDQAYRERRRVAGMLDLVCPHQDQCPHRSDVVSGLRFEGEPGERTPDGVTPTASLDGDPRHRRGGPVGRRAGDGSPRLRALLLHRAALAAAQCRERQEADRALGEAERVADRAGPGRDPDWLYWLDGAELAAMTGWCLAMLGRPLRAVPLLERPRPGTGRRGSALYGSWLARCHADLGELEQACQVARQVRTAALTTGSARAVAALRQLHPVLLRHRETAAVRRYARAGSGVTWW